MRVVLTALVSIAFCPPVLGQQNVDVYKGQGHIMDGIGTVIHRDSRCEAGKADDCTRYRASDIESKVKGAGTLLGSILGNPVEGGGRVMRAGSFGAVGSRFLTNRSSREGTASRFQSDVPPELHRTLDPIATHSSRITASWSLGT